MAIADNPPTFDQIRDNGCEASLEQLIAYAEMQARLHQSVGDREPWLFWVRSWANLQRASDAMAEGRSRPSHFPSMIKII